MNRTVKARISLLALFAAMAACSGGGTDSPYSGLETATLRSGPMEHVEVLWEPLWRQQRFLPL